MGIRVMETRLAHRGISSMKAFFSKINWAGVVEHFFKAVIGMVLTILGAMLCRKPVATA